MEPILNSVIHSFTLLVHDSLEMLRACPIPNSISYGVASIFIPSHGRLEINTELSAFSAAEDVAGLDLNAGFWV